MIEIKNLHKFFNKGKSNELHVLSDVSLSLPEKGIVAIFGRSGCGKTTLLNVIGGLDGYKSGSVSFLGQNIARESDRYRNRDVGYIFQNYNLLKTESCFDNVANALYLCGMNDKAEVESRVKTALSFVDMEQYAHRTPDTLSGGQQQRVAIARAIVKNPRIILADEPTGNLDETNTVMVMDLLREIARDCLVILVTHEAELVDFYCDRVIELSDGKIVNIRDNHITGGYQVRDKNTIYLGELEKDTLTDDAVSLSYYGQKPSIPIALKVINYGGKTYLSIDTPGIQILDKDSETKLCDGVFERREAKDQKEDRVDMSRLPRVEGHRFGRLFTAKRAIVSGYRSNFQKQKKGKNLLRVSLCLFAAVVVLMTAIFGRAIGDVIDMKNAYNPNVFYASAEQYGDLLSDPDRLETNGIDAAYIYQSYEQGDVNVFFNTGFFETFATSSYSNDFYTNGVYLPSTLAKNLPLIVGKMPTSEGEMVMTSKSADLLLEKSTLGYLESYDDLIGLTTETSGFDNVGFTVVGIIKSEETAFYIDAEQLARLSVEGRRMNLMPASAVGISVKSGETVYLSRHLDEKDEAALKIGDAVKVLGKDFLLSEHREVGNYDKWLTSQGVKREEWHEYCARRLKEEYPDLVEGEDAWYTAQTKIDNEEYYAWVVRYFLPSEELFKSYCRTVFALEQNLDLWLYLEKGIPDLVYSMFNYEVMLSEHFYKENGRYPTREEFNTINTSLIDQERNEYYQRYEKEFYTQNFEYRTRLFVLNDADYIALAARAGESHSYVDPYAEDGGKPGGYISYRDMFYFVLHSADVEKTTAFLESIRHEDEDSSLLTIVTPDDQFKEAIHDQKVAIITGLVTMGVILGVMSVCMYFIMRSSLMNRIREIGIYRAIGVSKKNLVFRFLVETAVLCALTVFVGYLIMSFFIALCMSVSSMVASIFFYPIPMAVAVLAVLALLSVICGLLPILRLLRKTPSAILAQYDI